LLPGSHDSATWTTHVERYGPLPQLSGRAETLRAEVAASELSGRGGAGFPTVVKLESVAARGNAVVVANGTEGEPASAKDKILMRRNPHLVLDGVLVAMAAVRTREAVVAVARKDASSRARLEAALRERRGHTQAIRLAEVPDRFVAGEESALVHWLNGGPAKPTFTPPRPFERGVGGRPTLVQNVETLANLGLVARYGAGWFRAVGTEDEPGSVLVTVVGAVRRPGVVEVALGTPLRSVLERCGGVAEPPRALLVGGYFGTWIPPTLDVPLSRAGLRQAGASLGARTLAVLPQRVCPLAETARIVRYLAAESAGQCGPCVFGLPAVADSMAALTRGGAQAAAALPRISELTPQVLGRGACAHPDGVVRLVASTLTVFADEVDHHLAGRCTASADAPLLPTASETESWR
jgi:NADH:ubiquinone oxidoreductase subunit F (NADH-binding)